MKYHLILTLDYELFGNGSGCLEHCVQKPTDQCLSTIDEFQAPMSFFVDASEFLAFSLHAEEFPGYSLIEQQLKSAFKGHHCLQLHLHPQWFDAQFVDGRWDLDLSAWRIGNLTAPQIEANIDQGMEYLSSLLSENDRERHLNTFRAGGWAIQPSHLVLPALANKGIKIDSTVAPGAYNWAGGDWYDFAKAPKLPYWHVSHDVNQPVLPNDSSRSLLEAPITSGFIGRLNHAKLLKQSRQQPSFPSGCQGSYAGPNNNWQSKIGKFSKLMNIGHCMLDFSTLPGDVLIDITRQHIKRFSAIDQPVPIVAIGHNKNFTDHSNAALKQWLEWANNQPDIVFSDYHRWHQALTESTH